MEELVRSLARQCGVDTEYIDFWGTTQRARLDTLQSVLTAMGVSCQTEEACHESIRTLRLQELRRGIAPTLFYPDYATFYESIITLPDSLQSVELQWKVTEEGGQVHEAYLRLEELSVAGHEEYGGEWWKHFRLVIPLKLSWGYHSLAVTVKGATTVAFHSVLTIYPLHCYLPQELEHGRKVWGIQAQVYNLRSSRNWGIGDFGDVRLLSSMCAELGGDVVGLSPLHALALRDIDQVSPYSPSSRAAYNALFLDVPAIEEFSTCRPARESVTSFQAGREITLLQESPQVEYERVMELKLSVLEMLYAEFSAQHLAHETGRARQFFEFLESRPEVEMYSLFEALSEHCARIQGARKPWTEWPQIYRNPKRREVQQFKVDRAVRVGFFNYLQWQADQQLAAIREYNERSGLRIGLYCDLALSCRRDGAEAWAHQDSMIFDAVLGAPPDMYNRSGQDWLAAPMNPRALQETHFAAFRQSLRATMRHAGAIRIDHVMAFQRLFWIPKGQSPLHGTYIRYPLQDYLAVVALESQRHRCVVIGEDLGVVSPEVRTAMHERRVLSYKVFLFFKDTNQDYCALREYPRNSLVVASVHDSPTLRGFWTATDIDVRRERGLLTEDEAREARASREKERQSIVQCLWREGLYVPEECVNGEYTGELSLAIHRFLARSSSMFALATLEDFAEQLEQINIPGTLFEYPNWCPKLAVRIQELPRMPLVQHIARAMREEGRGRQS